MYRTFEVQGMYDHWVVEEYHGDESRVVHSTISPIPTKKLATQIAAALNNAYMDGRNDVMVEMEVE